jgi:sarcosine oxidase
VSGEHRADVVVVGLGGIGSAAAYWCARAGADVVGLEQFQLGHTRGGSHDHSRLIRLAYHHPDYVRLAAQAFDVWHEVETAAGEQLVHITGGVDMFPASATLGRDVYAAAMRDAGIEPELLTGAEVAERWPAFAPPDDVEAMAHDRAGFVASERATAAHQRLARESGAVLHERCPVTAVRPQGDDVVVESREGSWRCRSVVLACGAWLNELLGPIGGTLPLTVTQEQISYLGSDDLEPFREGRFPVWIWHGTPTFYGFPVFGEQAVKAAEDHGGPVVTADTRSFEPDAAATERLCRFTSMLLPGLGRPVLSKTCLYTMTPDRDFVISALPEHRGVVLAVADGHGFKFASLLGRMLAGIALRRPPEPGAERFSAARPALRRPEGTAPIRV